ncbi:MAG TPA: hypothetical protein VGC06_08290, partial [Actinomycetes bacterium]
MGEVHLDGPQGHEQRLRDLAVGAPGGGQLGDPALTAGQGVDALQGRPPRAETEAAELVTGAGRDRQPAGPAGEIER